MANVSFWEALAAILGGAGTEFAERSKQSAGFKHEMNMAQYQVKAAKERDNINNSFTKELEGLKASNKLDEISAQGAIEKALQETELRIRERLQKGQITADMARTEMQRSVALIESGARRFDTMKQFEMGMARLRADYPESFLYQESGMTDEDKARVEYYRKVRTEIDAVMQFGPEADVKFRTRVMPIAMKAYKNGNTRFLDALDELGGVNVKGQTLLEEIEEKSASTVGADKNASREKGAIASWARGGGLKGAAGYLGMGAQDLGRAAKETGEYLWSGDKQGLQSAVNKGLAWWDPNTRMWMANSPLWQPPEEKRDNTKVQKIGKE